MKSARKSLRVESITTLPNGEVILQGEGLAIGIRRVTDKYSVGSPVVFIPDCDETKPRHEIRLAEIFATPGGLVF